MEGGAHDFDFLFLTTNCVLLPNIDFKCRGGWTHNNTQYFLVSFLEKFNYEYCIAYDMGSGEMRLVRRSHFCYRESQFSADHRPLGSASNVNNFFGHPKVFDHSFNDDLVTLQLINEGMQMTFQFMPPPPLTPPPFIFNRPV